MEQQEHRHSLIKTIGRDLFSTTGPRQLIKCVAHAIIGHHSLFEGGWLHRDVSICNILFIPSGLRGANSDKFYCKFPWTSGMERIGMLIDHGHAIKWRDLSGEAGLQRMGTIPFMSSRLLKAWESEETVIHHPLDDLESFLWVTMWVVAFHDTNKATYKEWRDAFTAPRDLLRHVRSGVVREHSYDESKTPRQRAFFRLMGNILTELENQGRSSFFATTLASPLQASQLKQYKDVAILCYHKIVDMLIEADQLVPESWAEM
ncbi:hypothetical protein BOTBODRAFT_157121 [Botryobasidium botryosum FD-172 SS1]|uniref:Fungal-type protein kinase domain-containing protein n=1 Tax=Botryobasidium botryosum (strain FD-172 SS1) TaxID=930990 RepID=A0A067MXP3_BOTB1|nr:hypothetical protein BOTBODRAFT_157121 [Botryobasidium botryosum FD-172 SS1]